MSSTSSNGRKVNVKTTRQNVSLRSVPGDGGSDSALGRKRPFIGATLGTLALVAAGVASYLFFRADMRAARARLLAGSRVLSTACGPIEAAEEERGRRCSSCTGRAAGTTKG